MLAKLIWNFPFILAAYKSNECLFIAIIASLLLQNVFKEVIYLI